MRHPSLGCSRLVINNNEGGAIQKGVVEDGFAYAGGGVVVVGRFGQVTDTNAGRLEREGGEEGGTNGCFYRRKVVSTV